MLTDHNEEGSTGLILNKPLDTPIQEAIPDFPEFDGPLYLGGPVDNHSLFYIHTVGDLIQDSIEITDGLFWGGNYDTVKLLIEGRQLGPDEIKFFVGYSGWSPNQLEDELNRKSWVVSQGVIRQIMAKELFEDYWKFNIQKSKKEYAVWANYPVNPSLN